MTIHNLPQAVDKLDSLAEQNDFGETALPFAPTLSLGEAPAVVPQQYLHVCRTLESVENILARMAFSDKYPLFAGRDGNTVFIQVGIVGQENYPKPDQNSDQVKIVYGRRWALEPTTPTSEVVQTVLLALKKAREHELREKLIVKTIDGKHSTTPFNSHQDLPLMAANHQHFSGQVKFTFEGAEHEATGHEETGHEETGHEETGLEETLAKIRFSGMQLGLLNITPLSRGLSAIQIRLNAAAHGDSPFPEMCGQTLVAVCDPGDDNAFLHALMKELIALSDRHVEENLSFDGFARFSHAICLQKIADFSYQTRNVKAVDDRFEGYFSNMSYDVDAAKAPCYAKGRLGQSQRKALQNNGVEHGYLPLEPTNQSELRAEPRLRSVNA